MLSDPPRLIFHIDVNSAFLSWESVRRLSEGGEDLRLIPSAIGGDRDRRTAVILAKSVPAKKYGITTGEPVSMALRKCPSLVIAKPDFRLYRSCSEKFLAICRDFAPAVEQFSIDECFLDMTGTGLVYPDPIRAAHELKDRIRDSLGFTVNVGIGPNKLLAKMAGDFEKPDKVHTLFADEIPSKLWPLPIGDLLFVGRKSAEKLRRYGIDTIGGAAAADIGLLRSVLGEKMGDSVKASANGIDNSPVRTEREEPRGFSISTTLEEDVTDAEAAKRILRMLAESVSARMREKGYLAFCTGVTIRSNDFIDRSHQLRSVNPTDSSDEIYRTAAGLFDELWDGETRLRLLGISLTNLTREETAQLSLFEDRETIDRKRKIDRSIDEIRKKYGSSSIGKGKDNTAK